jgi:uncharacterized protein YodC (DUF2158 family)
MALINDLFTKFLSSRTKFRTGDHVQSHQDGPLMIVQWVQVNRKTKSVTLSCKWFDSETKSTRTNLFNENDLIPFDWNNH